MDVLIVMGLTILGVLGFITITIGGIWAFFKLEEFDSNHAWFMPVVMLIIILIATFIGIHDIAATEGIIEPFLDFNFLKGAQYDETNIETQNTKQYTYRCKLCDNCEKTNEEPKVKLCDECMAIIKETERED